MNRTKETERTEFNEAEKSSPTARVEPFISGFLESLAASHGARSEETPHGTVRVALPEEAAEPLGCASNFEIPGGHHAVLQAGVQGPELCRTLLSLISGLDSCPVVARARAGVVLEPAQALKEGRAAGLAGLDTLKVSDLGERRVTLVEIRFRSSVRHLREDVRHHRYAFLAGSTTPVPEALPLLEPGPWKSSPGPFSEEERSLVQHAYRTSTERLSDELSSILEEVDQWLEEDRRMRRLMVDSYFAEAEKELHEEKKAVYYHLYFFQKEEEIDEKLRTLAREKAQANLLGQRVVETTAVVEWTGAALFEVPLYGFETPKGTFGLDALTGTVRFALPAQ